jgi:hypothetical protein
MMRALKVLQNIVGPKGGGIWDMYHMMIHSGYLV